MACLASCCPSSLQRPTAHFTIVSHNNNNIHIHSGFFYSNSNWTGKLRQQRGVTCSNNKEQPRRGEENCVTGAKRRQMLVGMTMSFAAFSFGPIISDASAEKDVPEGFRIYTDGENKFNILIPEGRQVGAGGGDPNGFKSVTAFYPDQNTSSNVSVIIMGLGSDFTKMESFGKVDEFPETLMREWIGQELAETAWSGSQTHQL